MTKLLNTMKILPFLFLLFFVCGCGKENPSEQKLKSVQSHNYIIITYNGIPSHLQIMDIEINKQMENNYQYDSLYVTCLPIRNEVEGQYTVTGQITYIYHFWSPKKNYGGRTWILYDNCGDSIQKYMGQIY